MKPSDNSIEHVQKHLGVYHACTYSEIAIYLKAAFEADRSDICECALCQNFMGTSYYNYRCVSFPKILDNAQKYYTLAATQGLAKAQCNLGMLYEDNYADNQSALYWFKQAADQDDGDAIIRYDLLKNKLNGNSESE